MKPDTYKLIQRCVETGTTEGLRRAYKINTSPSKKLIEEQIRKEVMHELCNWFQFETKPKTWEP